MRDPRVNPAPGDVVEPTPGTFWHVQTVCKGRVRYNVRVGQQWLNSGVCVRLAEWREDVKTARVVFVAD